MAKALVNSEGKVLLRNGKVATTDSVACCCDMSSDCCAQGLCSSADDISSVDCIAINDAFVGGGFLTSNADINPFHFDCDRAGLCDCQSVSVVADATTVEQSRCGFSPFHNVYCGDSGVDLGYSNARTFVGCSAEFNDCAETMGASVDPDKIYLTKTTSQSGATVAEACVHSVLNPTSCCDTNCDTCGDALFTSTYDPSDCSVSSGTDHDDIDCCDPTSPVFSHPISGSETLTDEYTDAMVYSNALDALPDYPDTWLSTATAGAGFINEERTLYDYTKVRYKLQVGVPGICYLKIFWNETFLPNTPPYTPVVTSSLSWEWAPANEADCMTPYSDVLETDVYEIAPATTADGTYVLTDIRWTTARDYVPDPGNPFIAGGAAGYVDQAFGPMCFPPAE